MLLDEVEKAHPDVLDARLQILEDGRLAGARSRTAGFMTKRVGEQLDGQGIGLELTRPARELVAQKGYEPALGARPGRSAPVPRRPAHVPRAAGSGLV